MSSAIAPTMIRLPTTKRAPSAMLLKIGAAGPREDGGHRIGQARASEADQHAAQCRTGHHAGLEHHGPEAGAPRDLVAGPHAGAQGGVAR
ncbi:hypothetical protein G6F68_020280 [Rhizopus microsporus]|nr:hypothetical protein G6F68_020280 [Rhizopus microsporus]